MTRPTCARCSNTGAIGTDYCDCSNTGAIGTDYCDCRAAARLRAQHAHWQCLLEDQRAENLARVERVIEAVPQLPIDDVISRLRRMAQVIGLDEEQLSAFKASQVGNRQGRSRRARAALERWTALVDQRHSMMRAFDQLDDDIYWTIHNNEEMQARLFSLIAQGEA